MHDIADIIKFLEQYTNGIKVSASEPVVESIRTRVYKAQPLTYELICEHVAKENIVSPSIIIGIAQHNVKKTPSDWSWVSKASKALSGGSTNVPEFYSDMLKSLDRDTSNLDDRVLALCHCIKNDERLLKHTKDVLIKKKTLFEVIEKHWTTATPENKRYIQNVIHEAIIEARLPFRKISPMLIQTIRETEPELFSSTRQLLTLAYSYPELQGAIAESLIVNRYNLTGSVDHDNLIKVYMSKYTPKDIEWRRCVAAICLSAEAIDPILSTPKKWTQEWLDIKTHCDIHIDLVGKPDFHIPKVVDEVLAKKDKLVTTYTLPDLMAEQDNNISHG